MQYAGIGSRRTPLPVLEQMVQIAEQLAHEGWTLRSGGADGADSAFEEGCDIANGKKEIYLPWRGFNGSDSPLYKVSGMAFEIARSFHPAWEKLSRGGRLLMARNCYQVLGADLNSPADFIICWTGPGGGTTQALRIAKSRGIPAINMREMDWKERLDSILQAFQPSVSPR